MSHVVLMGTKGGPAIRTGSTNPTSSLLVMDGRSVVVDCGLGVTRGLVDAGVALKDLATIFITHLHSDHYLELGPLLHTAWTAGLETPVTIYGPDGLARYWTSFLASMHADITLRIDDEGRPDLASLARFEVLEEGTVLADANVTIRAMRNTHPPLVETFALSFEGGRHVVFSGDTAYHPSLAGFAKGADLLVHEAILRDAVEALVARVGNGDHRLFDHIIRSHTTAQDAGRLATLAGVKALALNHLLPSDDPAYTRADWRKAVGQHWSGSLHIGTDGLRIDLD